MTVVRIKEEDLHLLDIASSPVKLTVARELVGTSSLPDFDSPFPIPPDCTLHNPMRITGCGGLRFAMASSTTLLLLGWICGMFSNLCTCSSVRSEPTVISRSDVYCLLGLILQLIALNYPLYSRKEKDS